MRSGQPGSHWTAAERQSTHERHFDFLRKRTREWDHEGEGLHKKVRKAAVEDRIASLDIALILENMLQMHNGQGLSRFEDDSEGKPENHIPPSLVLCLDWEQVQWCMVWFCRNKLQLCLEGIPDPTHVRHRNLEMATDQSGYRGVVYKSNSCHNVAYGPWQGGNFLKDIQDLRASMLPPQITSDLVYALQMHKIQPRPDPKSTVSLTRFQ